MEGGFKYVERQRLSKAQKKRDAKAAKKAEQLKRIEESEKLDEHKDRRLEQEALDEILNNQKLKVHDIEADGDCMFRAVEHQLSLAQDAVECLNHQQIRDKTSQHMIDNAQDFMPFLVNDQGDLMSEQEFRNYCKRIARTKEWGGHLELTAISQIIQRPIHVYQAQLRKPIVIEPRVASSKSPIHLSFHKHLYHLGEHYNSLVPA